MNKNEFVEICQKAWNKGSFETEVIPPYIRLIWRWDKEGESRMFSQVLDIPFEQLSYAQLKGFLDAEIQSLLETYPDETK